MSATVAANIRLAREAKGLTQRELADLVNGVESMAVSNWERGQHRPSLDNLVALGHALGCDVAWFYTDHANASAPSAA